MAGRDDESSLKAGRPQLPTDIPLNCPYCGGKLVNVPSDSAPGVLRMPERGFVDTAAGWRTKKGELKSLAERMSA